MRTTLTLDPDVAVLIRRLVERSKRPFKQVVNDVLRAGLALGNEKQGRPRDVYRVRTVSLGRPRLPDLDDIGEVLVVAEGERRP